MAKLFGTDGVRGVANVDLTPELCLALGRAAGAFLTEGRAGSRARLLVGRDTRCSGTMLQAALVAGANSVGIDCVIAGVLPTPGVAYLTRTGEYDAGVMISASHNPVEDNGIKFFSRNGYKLTDEEEASIEKQVQALRGGLDDLPRPKALDVGREVAAPKLWESYARFLQRVFAVDLDGVKVVVDCGNGAAYEVAPFVLRSLGADVVAVNVTPDGANINVECGSTHPEVAQRAVLEHGAQVGFSFDGDADRVIAVDECGSLVDGDHILAALGIDMLERGLLKEKALAATQYSNGGLRASIEAHGGSVVETAAGDRYVLEAMRKKGLALGGEQSGHIILLEHNTTGDGLLTALALLGVSMRRKEPLSALRARMKPMPQVLRNVRVRTKEGWDSNPRISASIDRGKTEVGAGGRIFVRASGTEPVIRVMGEGPDEKAVQKAVEGVMQAIAGELGG